MLRFVICLSGLILFGCSSDTTGRDEAKNAGQKEAGESTPAALSPTETDFSGCYIRVLKRDTMVANLKQEGNTISGKLTFDNFEKDGSTGTVKGNLEDSIIKLVYTFQSEGMNSVMDVYFKADSNSIIRGIGDMQTKGDTAYFTDPASVQYPANDKLVRIPCEEIPAKYK